MQKETFEIGDIGKLTVLYSGNSKKEEGNLLREVQNISLNRDEAVYNLLKSVPKGYQVYIGKNKFRDGAYPETQEIILEHFDDRLNYELISIILHEVGHTTNHLNQKNRGINPQELINRIHYWANMPPVISLDDLKECMGSEYAAWEFALGELKKMNLPKETMAKYFNRAKKSLQSHLDFVTHDGGNYLDPLSTIQYFGNGRNASEMRKELLKNHEAWLEKNLRLK